MLEVFFVSVHESRALRDVFEVLAEASSVYRVTVGVLLNWARYRSRREAFILAKRYGLPILVDHGGFQDGEWGRGRLVEYALWLRANRDLYDYALMPDVVAARRPVLDPEANARDAATTVRLHDEFYRLAHRVSEKLVPVAQGGYPPSLYIASIEYYLESGLAAAGLVALGSAKAWQRRSRWRETRGRLRELVQLLDRVYAGRIRLHLLGIHGLELRRVMGYSVVYSADSGSQGLNYRYKWRSVLGCESLTPECYRRSVERELEISLAPLRNKPLLP